VLSAPQLAALSIEADCVLPEQGWNTTSFTRSLWPLSVRTKLVVLVSHSLHVPLHEPVIASVPLGANRTDGIGRSSPI